MLWDISPKLTGQIQAWPGDTPLSRQISLDLARGDSVTLSSLSASVHLGAHADAPSHYGLNAPSIDERPLSLYLGPCEVISPQATRGRRIAPKDLLRNVTAARVLLRTGTFPDPYNWNTDFAALEPSLIDHLHERGVCLVGVDTPSVDLFESQDLPAHARLLAHDMAVIEGLVLNGVPDGIYELIALPLPLGGFDASPVRAILRPLK